MTLPTSGSISTDQILAELRVANANRNYPLSLNDADVLALAGKSAPPVTMPDDFYGKSATPPAQPLMVYPNGSRNSFSSSSSGTAQILLTVSAIGGARPLTFTWSQINSTDGFILQGAATGPSLQFTRTYNQGTAGTASASARCIVTDANGVTADTGIITGTATWGNA